MSKHAVNLYELKPRQKRSFEELEDGAVAVLVPRYGNNVVGRLLKRVLNERPVRVRLEDVGASVWRLCDGDRTVLEIGEKLQSEYGDRIEPLYDRLELFLKQMHRAGLIDLEN
jgi:hypothetical protein